MSLPTSSFESWRMFDRIAPTYDVLNRLLSFRRDVAWRRRIRAQLPDREGMNVLDLATGTGDVLFSLLDDEPRVDRGIGIDMSANMLARAKAKGTRDARAAFVRSDAQRIGAADESFDAVTIAFGIRNVPDVPEALREIHRVLNVGGRALILEFSLPGNPLMRALYLFYFRRILPMIGGWISGDREAYRYLNESVEAFPYGEAFSEMMQSAGFRNIAAHPLTFGIATLYVGERYPSQSTSRV